MKNFEDLKAEFIALKGEFEGYIMLSDKAPRIFECAPLPNFDALHNGGNFIAEAELFCKERNECITIRQINNGFLWQRLCLNDYPHKDYQRFITINGKVAKIAQIWEETIDENCENLPVLKHKFSLFAGFDSTKELNFEAQEFENFKGGENG